jgi:hypothetical protein
LKEGERQTKARQPCDQVQFKKQLGRIEVKEEKRGTSSWEEGKNKENNLSPYETDRVRPATTKSTIQ